MALESFTYREQYSFLLHVGEQIPFTQVLAGSFKAYFFSPERFPQIERED